jgi:hypothetical protein
VQQYKSDVQQYTERLKLAGEVVNVYQPLLDKGYVSKLQLMTASDNRTEMQRLLADARQLVDSNTQTMSALQAQREAYIQKWHSDVGSQLVTDSNDLDATRQLLEKAKRLRDLVSLDSPEAYRFLEYGVAKGVVKSVSQNSFTLDDNNQPVSPYFKVHVAITEVKLHNVPKNFRLLPGDTLTGDVMVGERTIMSYLLEGIMRTTSEAMREP